MHDAQSQKSRFFHRAGAFALGGRITRPFHEPIEVQAATSLPGMGGYASARVELFRHRELVSFKRAYTQVTGSAGDGSHETLAAAVIEKLNILDVVTADRVVARLTAVSHGGRDELSLLPVGSYFVNLRIAGVPVSPILRDVLARRGRRSELDELLGVEAAKADDIHALTSIFETVEPKDAPFDVLPDGVIKVPGFGRVVLGEYVITRNSRRLTMVSCRLGSPVEGTVEAGGVEGNGSGY